MKWTEQAALDFIERNNGKETFSLIKTFLIKLKQDKIFSYEFGTGKNFPSIRIFRKNSKVHKQIMGIEFYKPFTKEPGIFAWFNLAPHEETDLPLILKLRDVLGNYRGKYPYLKADDPAFIFKEIELIIETIKIG